MYTYEDNLVRFEDPNNDLVDEFPDCNMYYMATVPAGTKFDPKNHLNVFGPEEHIRLLRDITDALWRGVSADDIRATLAKTTVTSTARLLS